MIKKLFIAVSLFVSGVTQAADVVIDVPALAGKGKVEVAKIIGEPLSCAPSKHGEKCQYNKAETEIVFINGKADWITVEGLDDKPFSDSTLQLLGFKGEKPSFSNGFTKRWDSIEGVLSVSLFKGSNNSDYAYIKVHTK